MGKYPGTVIMKEKYPLNTITSKVKHPADADISFIQIDLFNELYPLFLQKISTFVKDA